MLGIDNIIIIQALIGSLTWFITYFFIRRLLNPDFRNNLNFEFKDGLYGGLAMFIMIILNFTLFKFYNTKNEISEKVQKSIPQ